MAENVAVVLPLHPRTSKLLEQNIEKETYKAIKENKLFKLLPPASFLEMIVLEKNAKIIMTDSGGVQKEAFFFKKPCIILRPETEWVEIVKNGTGLVTDADENKIKDAYYYFRDKKDLSYPPLYGDGNAAVFICSEILRDIKV